MRSTGSGAFPLQWQFAILKWDQNRLINCWSLRLKCCCIYCHSTWIFASFRMGFGHARAGSALIWASPYNAVPRWSRNYTRVTHRNARNSMTRSSLALSLQSNAQSVWEIRRYAAFDFNVTSTQRFVRSHARNVIKCIIWTIRASNSERVVGSLGK